jgi:sialidase-1
MTGTQRWIRFLLASWLGITCWGAAIPATKAQGQLFQSTDLFAGGESGVNTYRIPALVQTKSGTLIAIADARRDSAGDLPGHITLVMRRSFDDGVSWTAAKTVRSPSEGGVGDASLLLDKKTGRVWCFFAYGPPGIGFMNSHAGAHTGRTTLQVHAMYSDDDGNQWSAPVDLTPQIKDVTWQGLFATSGTNIQTSKGRYLVPLVVRDAHGVVSARNAYSDDAGKTWKVGQSLGAGTDESHAVELKDGTILQNIRDGYTRLVARSPDGGITFSNPEPDPALIDPKCNAGIAHFKRGNQDILIFTNAASRKCENLTVRLSFDGGHTWPNAKTLAAGPAGYSTVVPLRDGTIAVLYERGKRSSSERITFARFQLQWITEPRAKGDSSQESQQQARFH